MRIWLSVTFLLFCSLSTYAQNPNPDPVFDQELLTLKDDNRLPGLSTAIIKNGEIVWLESYGWSDFSDLSLVADTTAYLMASVSKTYTATALLQLWEDGLFDLDDPVSDYLSFAVTHPVFPDVPVTFRKVLTHTGSIRDNWDVMDQYYTFGDPVVALGDFLESLLSPTGQHYDPDANFYPAAPGAGYHYSNIGAALCGLLVEVISEQAFDQYCREHIFEPLCLDHTGWFLSDFPDTTGVARPHYYQGGVYIPIAHYGFPDYPDGLLRSSIEDVATYLFTYANGGTFYDRQLLESATIDSALTEQAPFGQGLLWYEEVLFTDGGTVTVWGHNGGESGASTDIYFDPISGIGVIAIANGEGSTIEICDALFNYALSLTDGGILPDDCQSISSQHTLTPADLQVFPNPTSGSLQLSGNDLARINGWQIIDLNGKTCRTGSGTSPISLYGLPAGWYQLTLTDSGGHLLLRQSVLLLP